MTDLLTAIRSKFDAQIPGYSYALLRIVLGAVGLLSLVGLTPIALYWPLDGLSPLPGDGVGIRAWIAARGLGSLAGTALFVWLLGSFGAMTLGIFSDFAVFMSFVGLVAQTHWNDLPLSSAHQVMTVLLFCLLWANTGTVWALDARDGQSPLRQAAWPLWLMRCQVAIVYLSSGLFKLSYPTWRDGTAVHWALNLNAFHRFPWPLPPSLAPLEVFLTWATLLFELGFWVLILFRRTRVLALVAGIALHVGLFATLELGPFSLLMIASYICYLDPERVGRRFRSSAGLAQLQ